VVLLSVILPDTDENHTVAGFVNDSFLHTPGDSTLDWGVRCAIAIPQVNVHLDALDAFIS
jgi:hypothetical protein